MHAAHLASIEEKAEAGSLPLPYSIAYPTNITWPVRYTPVHLTLYRAVAVLSQCKMRGIHERA